MNMEQLQKPKLCKKAAVLRKSVTNIMLSIRKFMSILILILTSLEEHQLKSIKKLSKRFSMMILIKDSFLSKPYSSCTV